MSTIMPKVSVIFPIYNNEKYLERCIRSVMNQTLKEIELILIDDGSKDSAPVICDTLAAEDERIVIVHKTNEGSAAGRNQGIDLARGEYVAFVESDDCVAEEMYEKLYNRAKQKDADIVKCGFYFCEGNHLTEAPFVYRVASDGEVFQVKDYPSILLYHASIWAGIYRRAFLNEQNLRCIVTPSATYSDFSWAAMTVAYAKKITIYHKAFYYYNYENPGSSFRQAGEKCFYKPFHCMEANRILREAGVFEDVKEEIGYSQIRTCLGHARNIRPDLRGEYFRRLSALMKDTCKDGFEFKRFRKIDKHEYAVKLLLKGDERKFYRFVDNQIRQIQFLDKLKKNKITSNAVSAVIRWRRIALR